MKKLYAKASFSGKNKANLKLNNGSGKAQMEDQAGFESQAPIMAFQLAKTAEAEMKLLNLDKLNAHHYYSISELANLNMMDHRHPLYHQQTRPTTFHEHHKLVLQLPLASSNSANELDIYHKSNSSNSLASQGSSSSPAATPIYERPSMRLSEDNNNIDNNNINTMTMYAGVSPHNQHLNTLRRKYINSMSAISLNGSGSNSNNGNCNTVVDAILPQNNHPPEYLLHLSPQRHNSFKSNFVNAMDAASSNASFMYVFQDFFLLFLYMFNAIFFVYFLLYLDFILILSVLL